MRMKIAATLVALTLAVASLPALSATTSIHTAGARAIWNDSTNKIGAEDTATDGATAQARYCLHSTANRVNCTDLAVVTVTNNNGSGSTVWTEVAVGTNTRITFRARRGGPYFNQSSWVTVGT
jgi:hypothetical protein